MWELWKLCQNCRQIVTAAKAGDSLPELSKFATAVKAVDSLSQNLSKIGKTLMCLNQTLSRYQTNSTNLAFKVELGKSYLQHGQASSQPPWLGPNHILRRASSFLCKPSPRLSFNGNHPSKNNLSSSAPPSWMRHHWTSLSCSMYYQTWYHACHS